MSQVKADEARSRCCRCESNNLAIRPTPRNITIAEIYCIDCTKKQRNIGKKEFDENFGSDIYPIWRYKVGQTVILRKLNRRDLWGCKATILSISKEVEPCELDGEVFWYPMNCFLEIDVTRPDGEMERLTIVDHDIRSRKTNPKALRVLFEMVEQYEANHSDKEADTLEAAAIEDEAVKAGLSVDEAEVQGSPTQLPDEFIKQFQRVYSTVDRMYRFHNKDAEEFANFISKMWCGFQCPPNRIELVKRLVREMIFHYQLLYSSEASFLVDFDNGNPPLYELREPKPATELEDSELLAREEIRSLDSRSKELRAQILECEKELLHVGIAQFEALCKGHPGVAKYLRSNIDEKKAHLKILTAYH